MGFPNYFVVWRFFHHNLQWVYSWSDRSKIEIIRKERSPGRLAFRNMVIMEIRNDVVNWWYWYPYCRPVYIFSVKWVQATYETTGRYYLFDIAPFSSNTILRDNWIPNRAISTGTVRNQQENSGYHARRPIKRLLLTPAYNIARLVWCQVRHRWNLGLWRKIHWSDENCFLLHMPDGRTHVWRQRNAAYVANSIQETTPFGGGSVMVWDVFRMIASWIWSLFKAILMGQHVRGTSWKLLSSLSLTTMLWSRDQHL